MTAQRTKNTRMISIALFLSIFLFQGIYALQLSMVASRTPFSRGPLQNSRASMAQQVKPAAPSNSVTSNLISQLAVTALKLRLHSQTHVSCDVSATSSNLIMRGQVGPVTVKGRGWGSRLGLTCRVIDATVEKCEIDMGRVLANQKLVLTVPAKGQAMVALNEVDFGNFITHPLMIPPALSGESESQVEFLKENVSIDSSSGSVTFFGKYIDKIWKFKLERGEQQGQRAIVTVVPAASESSSSSSSIDDVTSEAQQLAKVTSKFFNEMVFALDGTFLTFSDMMLTGKGKEPIIMLSLGILVRKFPSPGLDF